MKHSSELSPTLPSLWLCVPPSHILVYGSRGILEERSLLRDIFQTAYLVCFRLSPYRTTPFPTGVSKPSREQNQSNRFPP